MKEALQLCQQHIAGVLIRQQLKAAFHTHSHICGICTEKIRKHPVQVKILHLQCTAPPHRGKLFGDRAGMQPHTDQHKRIPHRFQLRRRNTGSSVHLPPPTIPIIVNKGTQTSPHAAQLMCRTLSDLTGSPDINILFFAQEFSHLFPPRCTFGKDGCQPLTNKSSRLLFLIFHIFLYLRAFHTSAATKIVLYAMVVYTI